MMTKFEKRLLAGIMSVMMCFSVVQMSMGSVKAEDTVLEEAVKSVTEEAEPIEIQEEAGKFITIQENIGEYESKSEVLLGENYVSKEGTEGEVAEDEEEVPIGTHESVLTEEQATAYYRFIPEQAGVYCIQARGGLTIKTENINIDEWDDYGVQKYVKLNAGEVCHISISSRVYYQEETVVWSISDTTKLPLIQLDEEYNETKDPNGKKSLYQFVPKETGRYVNSLNDIMMVYDNEWKYIGKNRVSLKAGKVYYLEIGNSLYYWPQTFTWKLEKAGEIPIKEDETFTREKEKNVEFKFTPQETGRYQFEFTQEVEFSLYDEKGEIVGGAIVQGNKRNVEQGQTYTLIIGGKEEVTGNIKKAEMIEIQENTVYTTTPEQIVDYRFIAQESGTYLFHFINEGKGDIYHQNWDSFYYGERYDYLGKGDIRVSLTAGETNYFDVKKNSEPVSWKVIKVKTSGSFGYRMKEDGTAELLEYIGKSELISIPGEIDGNKVTGIGEGVFKSNRELLGVYIPACITEVQYRAFFDCSELQKVEFASTGQLKTIEGGSFSYCRKLKNITIPDGVEKLGSSAFEGAGLTEVTIPDSVTEVGKRVFAGCPSLKNVNIGQGMDKISNYMFVACDNLTGVHFKNNTTTGSSSITKIEYGAFWGCSSLANLQLPDTVKSMGRDGMVNTAWLNSQEDDVVYLKNILYGYKGEMPDATQLAVKDGTTVIADSAFIGKKNLSNIELSDGVIYIGKLSFYNCPSMYSVVIPESVTEIGNFAFGYFPDEINREGDGGTYIDEDGHREWCKKIEGFTIYGVSGSAAQKYADENGFKFVAVATQKKGDVNDDGNIDSADLRLVLRAVCGKETLTDTQKATADVEGDGNGVDSQDMRKILQFVCGKIEEL